MTNPLLCFAPRARAALVLLPVLLAVVIAEQIYQWELREDYHFGFLVPFLAAYVLYDRWPELRKILSGADGNAAAGSAPAAAGTPVADALANAAVVAGALVFGLGAFMRASTGPSVFATVFNTGGFVLTAAATLWLACATDTLGRPLPVDARRRFLAQLTFPLLVWLVSGPLLYLMDTQIKILLLRGVTALVTDFVNFLGQRVASEVNVISILTRPLPDGGFDQVGVADACSGVRSLTACVFMGAFLSAVFVRGLVRKTVLVALSLALALVLNFLRTTFLTLWACRHGSQAIDGDLWLNPPRLAGGVPNPECGAAVHDVAGYVAMGATFALLLLLIPLVNLRLRKSDAEMNFSAAGSDGNDGGTGGGDDDDATGGAANGNAGS
ncbi:MAG: exosortase/archaeosortase family protein [Puniceicoccales bacterium]|jgi:exosortase/archaeosortase family protein|nr:exosortase/archaeosortase family protein [Puniceicoccales bacterium]